MRNGEIPYEKFIRVQTKSPRSQLSALIRVLPTQCLTIIERQQRREIPAVSIMADECCDISETVTAFLFNTCRLPPCPDRHDVQAAVMCAVVTDNHPPGEEEVKFIPLTTGSVAEFYIKPMLPHFGDIDVMYHLNTRLAIPRGHPPPTQLPAEFHNYVYAYEIIGSRLPGYVYLALSYLLKQRSDNGKYNYIEYDEEYFAYTLYALDDDRHCHGPAFLADTESTPYLSVDVVRCVRCLSWPPQAADWPTRHRNYGWPNSAILDRVVSNGCDVVGVAHRQCRQHEWMGKRQWRLSFSRAEIVLINNNWTPLQQIVYHMLRVYVKTKRLTESADDSGACPLSNYHIKTLMLWACELKPASWWTDNLNLVRICVKLLNNLSVWLTDARCPHYFIDNCNLLDNSFNKESVACILLSIDKTYLSTWFVDHYVKQCAQLCPRYISRLSGDVSTKLGIQKVVSEIVRWRLDTSLAVLWDVVFFTEFYISSEVSRHSFTARSCACYKNELTKIDKRFSVYFSAIALLHVACKVSRNGISDELMYILSTLFGRNFNECYSEMSRCRTEPNTSEMVEFLQKSAVEHLTTYRQLIERELGSVATIVTTDFEALYAYKRGEYQQCLQLSTQNVEVLLHAEDMPSVPILSDIIQLLDNDIVSLTALTLIVNPRCRDWNYSASITQLTLSLYLMAQCQLKLHHSVTSLAQTLDYVKDTHKRYPPECMLDKWTLKLIARKAFLTICTNI